MSLALAFYIIAIVGGVIAGRTKATNRALLERYVLCSSKQGLGVTR